MLQLSLLCAQERRNFHVPHVLATPRILLVILFSYFLCPGGSLSHFVFSSSCSGGCTAGRSRAEWAAGMQRHHPATHRRHSGQATCRGTYCLLSFVSVLQPPIMYAIPILTAIASAHVTGIPLPFLLACTTAITSPWPQNMLWRIG